jgi:hypothetical protein
MFRSAGIIFYELVTFKRPFYNLREILNDKELEISNLEMNINFKQIINKFLIYNYSKIHRKMITIYFFLNIY